jgi:hypothetical protein
MGTYFCPFCDGYFDLVVDRLRRAVTNRLISELPPSMFPPGRRR